MKSWLSFILFYVMINPLKSQTHEIALEVSGVPLTDYYVYAGSVGYFHTIKSNISFGVKLTAYRNHFQYVRDQGVTVEILARYPVLWKNHKICLYSSGGLAIMKDRYDYLPQEVEYICFMGMTQEQIDARIKKDKEGYTLYNRISPGISFHNALIWKFAPRLNIGVDLLFHLYYRNSFESVWSPALRLGYSF
jgi:hypothetical protein